MCYSKRLHSTVYNGRPAVEVYDCLDRLQTTLVNIFPGTSMLRFMQIVAEDYYGLHIIFLRGQDAYLD